MPQPSTSTTSKTPNTNAKKPAASSVVSSVDGEIIADFILAELQMSGREIHLSFSFSDPHSIPYSRMMTAVLTKQIMKLRIRGHLSERGRSHAPEFASANQYKNFNTCGVTFYDNPLSNRKYHHHMMQGRFVADNDVDRCTFHFPCERVHVYICTPTHTPTTEEIFCKFLPSVIYGNGWTVGRGPEGEGVN